MTDQIKNRVVGTVVLFTLAIIFLPDIFDGKKNELKEEFAVIPAKPAITKPVVVPNDEQTKVESQTAKNISADLKNEQEPTDESPVVVATKVSVPASKKPTTKPFKQASWVIQMGIFKQASSVKPYLVKLREKGFNAFSVPNKPKAGEATTVYIGPDLNKANLEKLQPKLKSLFKESGYIKKFNPTPNRSK